MCILGIEPGTEGLMLWYMPTSGFARGHISGHKVLGSRLNSRSIMLFLEFILTKIHNGLNVEVFEVHAGS